VSTRDLSRLSPQPDLPIGERLVGIQVVGDQEAVARSLERVRELVAGSFPLQASGAFAELGASLAELAGGAAPRSRGASLPAGFRERKPAGEQFAQLAGGTSSRLPLRVVKEGESR
jgi:hypothetical protein